MVSLEPAGYLWVCHLSRFCITVSLCWGLRSCGSWLIYHLVSEIHLVMSNSLWPTLCDSMVCRPPGSSVHGFLQTRIPEWVAISFSRGFSWLRDWAQVSCIAGRLYHNLSHQGSPHLPSCTDLILISLCRVLSLHHSFKSCALPPSLLFHSDLISKYTFYFTGWGVVVVRMSTHEFGGTQFNL